MIRLSKIRASLPWLLALLLLAPTGELGADPSAASSGSHAGRKAKKARKANKAKKARRKKARRKKARRKKTRRKRRVKKRRVKKRRSHRRKRSRKMARVAAVRCKDIFCTSRVMALEGKGDGFKQLSSTQVERVMHGSLSRLEPCLVQERRKNPHIKGATIEFVVGRKGRVLASRLAPRRRGDMERCLKKAMASLRFPRVSGRTVATFTVHVPR